MTTTRIASSSGIRPLAAHVSCLPERALVRLIGELDIASAERAEAALLQAEAGGAPVVELDLSGLDFMDSTGLRLLLRARERAARDGHALRLRRGSAAVQRVFELTATTSRFDFIA